MLMISFKNLRRYLQKPSDKDHGYY